jgi:hypothetical protein
MIYEVYHKNDKTHRDRERERDVIYIYIYNKYIFILFCVFYLNIF